MANDILTTLDDGVLTVSFNRPNKKNSVTADMYEALTSAIHRAEDDADIKLLLFTGVGEVFSAGNDINDFLKRMILFSKRFDGKNGDFPLEAGQCQQTINGSAMGGDERPLSPIDEY